LEQHERRAPDLFAEHFQQNPRQNDICFQITLLVSYGLQVDFVDQFLFVQMCSANIPDAGMLRLSLHHAQFPASQQHLGLDLVELTHVL
jgi:hypothetical protein